MLKTSTSHAHFHEVFGEKGALKAIKDCGFDGVDFGFHAYQEDKDFILLKSEDEIKSHFSKLKDYADSINLDIAHTHAPYYFCEPDQFLDKEFQVRFINSIKATRFMGCDNLVIHPIVMHDPDNTYKINMEYNIKYYSAFIPTMEKYNVNVAIENMDEYNPLKKSSGPSCVSSAEKILDLIEHLHHEKFVVCLDVGHAFCSGQYPDHMARLLGDKLKVLHLHDNDGHDDMHIPPTCGHIDWDAFCKALKDINFSGYINTEVNMLRSGANNIKELGSFLCAIDKHFIKKIEEND